MTVACRWASVFPSAKCQSEKGREGEQCSAGSGVMELGKGGVGKLRYLTRSKRAARHEGSALGVARRNYAAN